MSITVAAGIDNEERYDTIQVDRIGGSLGAIVSGVDPRDDLTDQQFAEIHEALLRHEVIIFRNVPMSADAQLELAARWGSPSIYPLSAIMGATKPSTSVIRDDADSPPTTDNWHTDVTWIQVPPKIAFLQATVVPPYGGDTMWCSTTSAYDALSAPMREMVNGWELRHSNYPQFCTSMAEKSGSWDLVPRLREAYPGVNHPLVRTHPETGRRALYLATNFHQYVVGLNQAESAALLDFLTRHIDQPRFCCRWSWSEGDLAIWDERSTNHRGVADHYPEVREVRRCTVDGDRPYFDPSVPYRPKNSHHQPR
ncbi:TauD/TfdA dioxygenase family protein [Candidatus Poriferisocius sp.]|uniref:TauD/TfdA dioxygenase family protein n=1 Tax=Candidatus Poriferisocius sp. TaxID=3101276 RepID=UPI003B0282BF